MYTADLCDYYRDQVKVADSNFERFGRKATFHGPIVTLKVFEDNVLVKKALQTIPSGSVLVIDGGGSRRCALVGDNLAAIAKERKISGIVVNGCIRDSAQINDIDVGIYGIGTNPFKSKKEGNGEENSILAFAGIRFKPGSYLYADCDGIIVSDTELRK